MEYCKAKNLLKQSGAPIVQLSLDKIADSIFEKDLTLAHVEKARQNNNPIIVACYERTQSFIVIDGNHRAYAKLQDKIYLLKGIWLQCVVHLIIHYICLLII